MRKIPSANEETLALCDEIAAAMTLKVGGERIVCSNKVTREPGGFAYKCGRCSHVFVVKNDDTFKVECRCGSQDAVFIGNRYDKARTK